MITFIQKHASMSIWTEVEIRSFETWQFSQEVCQIIQEIIVNFREFLTSSSFAYYELTADQTRLSTSIIETFIPDLNILSGFRFRLLIIKECMGNYHSCIKLGASFMYVYVPVQT